MIIYTDSSFNEKSKVAGIGCVLISGQKRYTFSNWIKAANNNIGELYAIYYALNIARRYPGPHTVMTDSQTAIGYITGNIKDKEGTPEQVRNRLECKKWAYRINQISPEGIILGKVKAHTGHYQRDAIQNALADLLAKEGVVKFLESQGTKQKPKQPCIFVLPDQNQR